MLVVQGKIISDAVIEEQFMCNLEACKGACCWEGDYGAPLETAELDILKQIYDHIKPYLSAKGISVIEKEGLFTYYTEAKEYGTPLIDNGACVYMTYDPQGVAQCGIEQAYNDGVINFKKPISCHLYPIRVTADEKTAFEALNYDRWDICSAACKKGAEHKMPVFRFAKAALIRKYGADFYAELEAAFEHLNN
ncbi:MAG: DUF3109 family protein [Saprospiraceae bacterium]